MRPEDYFSQVLGIEEQEAHSIFGGQASRDIAEEQYPEEEEEVILVKMKEEELKRKEIEDGCPKAFTLACSMFFVLVHCYQI